MKNKLTHFYSFEKQIRQSVLFWGQLKKNHLSYLTNLLTTHLGANFKKQTIYPYLN